MERDTVYEEAGRQILSEAEGAPILLIGIGGVGGRIAAQVDRMLAKDSIRRKKLAILAIDTNVKDFPRFCLPHNARKTVPIRRSRCYIPEPA